MYDFVKGSIKFIRGNGYPYCHTVLVDDRQRGIIDASADGSKLRAFKAERAIDYLITSHGHEDHFVFNYLFPESQFCAHPSDAQNFVDIDSLLNCSGYVAPADRENLRQYLGAICHYQPRAVDLFLQDGFVLNLGGVNIEVIHTPGHTAGHCSFYFREEKLLFTADLDLTKSGPYYGDRSSDVDALIDSLNHLKSYKAETFLTAHGKGIYEGDPAYIDQYLAIIFSREEKITDLLRKAPKTFDEIVAEGFIYGKNPPSIGLWKLLIFEKGMIRKHLDRLLRMNRVRPDGEFFVLIK
jgi:hydroxyacylglutathione hydrolase